MNNSPFEFMTEFMEKQKAKKNKEIYDKKIRNALLDELIDEASDCLNCQEWNKVVGWLKSKKEKEVSK